MGAELKNAVILSMNKFNMKTAGFRVLILAAAMILLLVTGSCTTQRVGSHRTGSPKGCDCPKFK
jgi:hypothetical protein